MFQTIHIDAIPDKAGTVPDKAGTIPDKAGTIPDIIGTITYNIFFPWVIFRTNICIVHNMTNIFGTIQDSNIWIVQNTTKNLSIIPDKNLHSPEYDQKHWHYSGQ